MAALKIVTVTTTGLVRHKTVFRDPVSVWSDGIFLVVFYFAGEANCTLCRQQFVWPYILNVEEVDWLPLVSCTCEWCRGISLRNRGSSGVSGVVTDGS